MIEISNLDSGVLESLLNPANETQCLWINAPLKKTDQICLVRDLKSTPKAYVNLDKLLIDRYVVPIWIEFTDALCMAADGDLSTKENVLKNSLFSRVEEILDKHQMLFAPQTMIHTIQNQEYPIIMLDLFVASQKEKEDLPYVKLVHVKSGMTILSLTKLSAVLLANLFGAWKKINKFKHGKISQYAEQIKLKDEISKLKESNTDNKKNLFVDYNSVDDYYYCKPASALTVHRVVADTQSLGEYDKDEVKIFREELQKLTKDQLDTIEKEIKVERQRYENEQDKINVLFQKHTQLKLDEAKEKQNPTKKQGFFSKPKLQEIQDQMTTIEDAHEKTRIILKQQETALKAFSAFNLVVDGIQLEDSHVTFIINYQRMFLEDQLKHVQTIQELFKRCRDAVAQKMIETTDANIKNSIEHSYKSLQDAVSIWPELTRKSTQACERIMTQRHNGKGCVKLPILCTYLYQLIERKVIEYQSASNTINSFQEDSEISPYVQHICDVYGLFRPQTLYDYDNGILTPASSSDFLRWLFPQVLTGIIDHALKDGMNHPDKKIETISKSIYDVLHALRSVDDVTESQKSCVKCVVSALSCVGVFICDPVGTKNRQIDDLLSFYAMRSTHMIEPLVCATNMDSKQDFDNALSDLRVSANDFIFFRGRPQEGNVEISQEQHDQDQDREDEQLSEQSSDDVDDIDDSFDDEEQPNSTVLRLIILLAAFLSVLIIVFIVFKAFET